MSAMDSSEQTIWIADAHRNDWGFNAERLWNDEYFIGPRIFCLAAGWVTTYVDVSPLRIERAKDISGLARHRLSGGERRFGGGRRRGTWFYFKRR